ncbi:MAG: hypothetical protein M1824_004179 [Vezdaea acicularis]|nr:MAG: hypothetical protein M1824_004179 [Vezdaea acicularis]
MPPPPPGRLNLKTLTRAERKAIEEKRRNYLLALYGTAEQQRRYAHLLKEPAPYDIFADDPETAPLPPPKPEWALVAPTEGQAALTMSEEAMAAQEAQYPVGAQLEPMNVKIPSNQPSSIETTLEDPSAIPNALSGSLDTPLMGTPVEEDAIDFHDGGGLMQATSLPHTPTAAHSRDDITTTGNMNGMPSTAYLVWWAFALTLIVLALYRFRNSRAWRRIYHGAMGRHER